MSNAKNYEARTEELLAPIVEEYGVRIYDVEYVKEAGEYYLRAYIDKDGGVDIIDCENVSRALSDALDREDFIPDAYILEVSSPGLGRALKKDRHLAQSIGMDVELKLYKANEKGKDFAGVLVAFDADTLTTKDPETGEETVWNRKDIAKINLALDF
jgi:ribosome maturation factor RimP